MDRNFIAQQLLTAAKELVGVKRMKSPHEWVVQTEAITLDKNKVKELGIKKGELSSTDLKNLKGKFPKFKKYVSEAESLAKKEKWSEPTWYADNHGLVWLFDAGSEA